jgi:hypothetical protein
MNDNPTINNFYGFWKVLEQISNSLYLCVCTACNKTQKHIIRKKLSDQSRIVLGETYGHWRAIERDPDSITYTICQCIACNNTTARLFNPNLLNGTSKSWGCKKTEFYQARFRYRYNRY